MAANDRALQTGRRHSLRCDIALALAFKAVALTILYHLFFAPYPVAVTPERVAAALGMPSGRR